MEPSPGPKPPEPKHRALIDATDPWRRSRELLLQAARAQADGPRLLSVPVPLRPLPAVLTLWPERPAALWWPAAGPELVGLGAARILPASLAPEVLRAAVRLEQVTVSAAPGVGPVRPRFLGGLPFADGALAAPEWTDFRDGALLLPRVMYERRATFAVLSVFFDRGEQLDPSDLMALFDALCALPARLAPSDDPPDAEPRLQHLPETDWARYLERLLEAISAGTVDKVVAARRSTVPRSGPVSPVVLAARLERLRREQPQATILLLRRRRSTFLSATPELLVQRRGRALVTEALAGSLPRAGLSEPELIERLLASPKDRAEHAIVVSALQQVLEPLCVRLDVPTVPTVRLLPHLGHLRTPVSGELREDVSALELALRLHPTPAVGGSPTAAALALIAEHEPAPRGLYAAPFGWFDDRGDGDFAVAIRSALLLPDCAHLYAGAGIVRGSTATAEYHETAAKLRALAEVLAGPEAAA